MLRFVAAASLVFLVGCSESIPTGDPAESLRRDIHGYVAPIGVMVGLNEKAYWVQNAVSGWTETTADDVPAEIEVLARKGNCKFTEPKSNELVAKVMTNTGGMKAGVFATSRARIGEIAVRYIKRLQDKGSDAAVLTDFEDDMPGVVDVIVTETSQPVYLVLSHNHDVLFNIHLAADAKLARVALVGPGTAGVANVPADVPVESLDGEASLSCKVVPIRRPAEHWTMLRNFKEISNSDEELAKFNGFVSRYASWFKSNFKVSFEPDLAGVSFASHVLVGPMPQTLESRVTFRPVQGSLVRISNRDVVFAGHYETYIEKKQKLIVETATKAAGGDLASVTRKE